MLIHWIEYRYINQSVWYRRYETCKLFNQTTALLWRPSKSSHKWWWMNTPISQNLQTSEMAKKKLENIMHFHSTINAQKCPTKHFHWYAIHFHQNIPINTFVWSHLFRRVHNTYQNKVPLDGIHGSLWQDLAKSIQCYFLHIQQFAGIVRFFSCSTRVWGQNSAYSLIFFRQAEKEWIIFANWVLSGDFQHQIPYFQW